MEQMPEEAKFEVNQTNFFLTYAQCNLPKEDLLKFFESKLKNIKRYCIAQEKHKDGNFHLHVYLQLKRKLHTTNPRYFDCQGFHPNNAGTVKSKADVVGYCVKQDKNYLTNMSLNEIFRESKLKKCREYLTYTKDQFLDLNPIQLNQVWRARAICQKLSDQRPEQLQQFEFQLKDWQNYILEEIKNGANKRTIHWIYDETGGTGKTTFAIYLTGQRDSIYLTINKKEDILFRVTVDIRFFIFDIPRSGREYVNYNLIETLKNGYWEYGKYEGGTVRRDSPAFVFCFANILPKISELSIDRWNIIEIFQDGSFSHVNAKELGIKQQEEDEKMKLENARFYYNTNKK